MVIYIYTMAIYIHTYTMVICIVTYILHAFKLYINIIFCIITTQIT